MTLGGREHMFGEEAIHGPLEDMLRPILRGTLAYVGFDVLEPFAAWHVPYISTEARKDFLLSYGQRLENIADDQPIEFPLLSQFDDALYPLVEKALAGNQEEEIAANPGFAANCSVVSWPAQQDQRAIH